ncbi:MAG: branched-chain amino acid ABC transporter permease [Deferrisomatales bacterium]|nr:branched-chain amino acid ABC transporter permease [Deferrisomatales bacterium]
MVDTPVKNRGMLRRVGGFYGRLPVLGWLLAGLVAALLENPYVFDPLLEALGAATLNNSLGEMLAEVCGLPKIPVLFGFTIALKKPFLVPGALAYLVLIYLLPVTLVTALASKRCNRAAAWLQRRPTWVTAVVHMALCYAVLHVWADVSAYRVLVLKLTMIAVMLTLSLNLINGYMGEFSCSHPGFMALGAYAASAITVGLFVNDKLFGPALLPEALGPWLFPLALVFGGLVASLGALVVAIPSFRTRGDYLAIISLAFLFIVKSIIENLEFIGGPRGLGKQPDWSTLFTVFAWTMLCLWTINNYVRSTYGKAMNAVRDDEIAATAMTVDTRRTKMVTFLLSAFWAGVAGGLFAHVLRYVNPGTFGIQKLAEMLAMVYFGGLNSLYGSIVGAVSISMLGEALRPLEIWKWIIIPLLLILVMIYRPTGLIAFKELDVKSALGPRGRRGEEG